MTAYGWSAASEPFRPFFVLAALNAILGASVWIPLPLPGGPSGGGEWHRDALLFGTMPAMLAGFLLTALPRWAGRPAFPAAITWSLAVLWLCGRAVSVFMSPTLGLALACVFILTLALIITGAVIAAHDLRNVKVALLLLAFGAGAILTASPADTDSGLRIALASVVGLLTIIGGRVAPVLTLAFAGHGGKAFDIRPSPAVELVAALASASALFAWVVASHAAPTTFACTFAACAQAVRMARWRIWTANASAVLALHVGYGWIVAGFALLALHGLVPGHVDRLAAIHAWTIGAAGTLGIAIMTSMIRKHARRAFRRQGSATAAFILVTASCLSRLLAGTLPGDPAVWTTLSGSTWIAAFCLFLVSLMQLDKASKCVGANSLPTSGIHPQGQAPGQRTGDRR